MREWLQDITFAKISDVSSVVSLVLTLWVLVTVRKLRSYYIFKARVPELVQRLSSHSSNVSGFLNDFVEFGPQIRVEVARMEVVLRSLKRKISGQPKRSVAELLRLIKRNKSENSSEQELRDIYLRTVKIVDEIEDLREDLEWKQ